MAKLSSKQANDLSNYFLGMAQAIGDFRYSNWNTLSKSENQKLGNYQWSILNYGEDILALSTNLVMNEVVTSLKEIESITIQIKSTILNLNNIQKGINVAANIVTLGAAIISKNPQTIGESINNVYTAWNK